MERYIVVRVEDYGNIEFPTLASTLLFNEQQHAENEARNQAEMYGHGVYQVHKLTEPVYVVQVQPTEAAEPSV